MQKIFKGNGAEISFVVVVCNLCCGAETGVPLSEVQEEESKPLVPFLCENNRNKVRTTELELELAL